MSEEKKKQLISEESASEQLKLLADEYEFDFEFNALIHGKEFEKVIYPQLEKFKRYITKGFISVESDSQGMPIVIQKLKRPVGGVSQIKYGTVSAEDVIYASKASEGDKNEQAVQFLGKISSLGRTPIARLQTGDMKISSVIEAVFTIFSGA